MSNGMRRISTRSVPARRSSVAKKLCSEKNCGVDAERLRDGGQALLGDVGRQRGRVQRLPEVEEKVGRRISRRSRRGARTRLGGHGYAPWCDWIARWTCSLTASRLNDAPFCIGGKSTKVWADLATSCWTKTKRQNSYMNQFDVLQRSA